MSGRKTYVPKIVLDELAAISLEDAIEKQNEQFKKMVEYAEVGREMERLRNLNWKKTRRVKFGF
jgi:hypothetical protein